MSSSVISAKRVQGSAVTNDQHEDLGRIEDVMIDKRSGRIVYAILSFGGFLGMGEKHFAVPWEALTYSPDHEAYQIGVDKEVLKRAPGFERETAPDMADRGWGEQIHRHYGLEPYWTTRMDRDPD